MKIIIGTDSRGIWPGLNTPNPGDWPNTLKKILGPEHEIETLRAWYDHYLFSIFVLADHIRDKPDKHYDLIILQSGWHEGVCYWPEDILQNMAGSYFNPECLTRHIKHTDGHDKYLYIDKDGLKNALEFIKTKTKNLLCLGMHALRTSNDLDTEYHEGIQHHYDVLTINNEISKHADYFHMPMNNNWIGLCATPDGVHYNPNGINYLVSNILAYINNIDKTINNVIQDFAQTEKFNHTDLYLKAKSYGSYIKTITNLKDVVLIARRNKDLAASEFLGCILYGRIPLIIQFPSSKVTTEVFNERMESIQEQAKPSLCICDPEDVEKYENYFKCYTKTNKQVPKEINQSDPQDIAFYQLSSGTSGNTKLCKITHRQIVAHCLEYAKVCNLTEDKCVVSWLPLYHDMGLIACFLMPLLNNTKFYFIDTFEWLHEPIKLLEYIDKYKATHIWLPNFAFSYLEQKLDIDQCKHLSLSSLEQAISCSEPTFLDDIQRFFDKFNQLGFKENVFRHCYALAENIFAIAQSNHLNILNYESETYITCGRILPGISLIILDQGNDVTDVGIGNIMIKSIYEPINNEHSEFYGYYDTGDIGFMANDELVIIGRAKDMFISMGINVYPHNIEQKVSKLSGIISGRVVCVGLPTDIGTQQIGLAIESHNPNQELQKEIMFLVNDMYNLSPKVVCVEPGSLIKTSSGKLCRQKNKKFFQ